jgi:hypothetical protein
MIIPLELWSSKCTESVLKQVAASLMKKIYSYLEDTIEVRVLSQSLNALI